MNRYLLFFSILFLLGYGCADDQGNYDYDVLNTITIDSIHKSYNVIRYDSIELIQPELSFKLEQNTDLSYEWKVNYKVVSTQPYLNVPIDAPLGRQNAALIVTDNKTGVQYFKEFEVNVTTSYANGLIVLSERADESAMLSYQRRDKKGQPFQTDIFEEINPRQGKLGNQPQKIILSSNMQSQYFYYILCKEGEKKLTTLDANTLELTQIDNETTVSGGYHGSFFPTAITQSASGGVVLSEGKLFTFNMFSSGKLYRPVPGDYYLDWTDFNQVYGAYAQFGYDRNSQQFLVFTPTPDDQYTYDNYFPYHEIDKYDGEVVNTSGQEFVAAGSTGTPYVMEDKKIILRNRADNKAYFYTFNINIDLNETYTDVIAVAPYGLTLNMTKENFITDESVCCFAPLNRYWYIANGREITRLFWDSGSNAKVFTLPGDIKGEITVIAFDEEENEMYVGIYDENSTNTHKGSILVMDPETGDILENIPNAGEKPVCIIRKE